MKESHTGRNEHLVQAIARACLSKLGLRTNAAGLLLTPVPYSAVARCITEDCPWIEFHDDYSNSKASLKAEAKTDREERQQGKYQPYSMDPCNSQPIFDLKGSRIEAVSGNRTYNGDSTRTLTDILDSKECKRFFAIVHSFKGSQPHVIADLHALIQKPQLHEVQDVLPLVQTRAIHPEELAAYLSEDSAQTTAPTTNAASSVVNDFAGIAAMSRNRSLTDSPNTADPSTPSAAIEAVLDQYFASFSGAIAQS